MSPTHRVRTAGLPRDWARGLPLGNGELGVMCWSDVRRLRFTLDHAEAWHIQRVPGPEKGITGTWADVRRRVAEGDFEAMAREAKASRDRSAYGPTKVYLGRMELTADLGAESELSLSLEDALVKGRLTGPEGPVSFMAFVDRDAAVFSLRVDPWPEGAEVGFVPYTEFHERLAALGNPEPEVEEGDGIRQVVLRVGPDRFFALVWNLAGPVVHVATAYAHSAGEAREAARNRHEKAAQADFDLRRERHSAAWREFMGVSEVALPEADLEFLWHQANYMVAASARPGVTPPGLQGLWAMDGRQPPWKGDYHLDLNVQQYFAPVNAAGHPELADAWLDEHFRVLPKAEAFTRRFFGGRGAFMPAVLLPGFTHVGDCAVSMINLAWSHTGWLAQMAWLRWRYTMDRSWLKEKGYPIVRSAFLFYLDHVEEGDDGRLHVPLSCNPEYQDGEPDGWARDPNVDLALIHKCCDWLVEMEAALGSDEFTAEARDLRERLVPYHMVEFDTNVPYVKRTALKGRRVLGLWKDKPLDQSHRHPSHLTAIYPAMDITIDDGEEACRIIDASLRHYLSLGQYCWAAHTYCQMTSFAAVVGRGEMAHNFLRRYCDSWILENGHHFNRELGFRGDSWFSADPEDFQTQASFTVDSMTGIGAGISDMLLQSWGKGIRLFPAAPKAWSDACFRGLRAEGGFEASAVRRGGRVVWARIRSPHGGILRLLDSFEGQGVVVLGAEPGRNAGWLVWTTLPGDEIVMTLPNHEHLSLAEEMARVRRSQAPPRRLRCETEP